MDVRGLGGEGLRGGFDEVEGARVVALADEELGGLEGEEEGDVGVGELDGFELGEEGGACDGVVAVWVSERTV